MGVARDVLDLVGIGRARFPLRSLAQRRPGHAPRDLLEEGIGLPPGLAADLGPQVIRVVGHPAVLDPAAERVVEEDREGMAAPPVGEHHVVGGLEAEDVPEPPAPLHCGAPDRVRPRRVRDTRRRHPVGGVVDGLAERTRRERRERAEDGEGLGSALPLGVGDELGEEHVERGGAGLLLGERIPLDRSRHALLEDAEDVTRVHLRLERPLRRCDAVGEHPEERVEEGVELGGVLGGVRRGVRLISGARDLLGPRGWRTRRGWGVLGASDHLEVPLVRVGPSPVRHRCDCRRCGGWASKAAVGGVDAACGRASSAPHARWQVIGSDNIVM